MKKYLLLGIPSSLLIFALVLTVLTRNTQTNVNSQAASGTIDTLPYLLGKHSVGASDDPKNINMTQYVAGNSVFHVKSSGGSQYEYHTWDATNVYLIQDTSVGGVEVGGTEPNSYTYEPGRGIWMKRNMGIGESIVVVPHIKWFDKCKEVGAWPTWTYTVILEDQRTVNIGGDLGNQPVIVLKYHYGSGFERFYYSRDWGYVRWEEYDQTGKLKREVSFNRIKDNLFPIKTSCGTPQPHVVLPTPSPKPTKTPKPTPTIVVSPTQNSTPTPVATISTDQNSCPEPGNPACYDCNFDGVVNILDFSCFSKNYGK